MVYTAAQRDLIDDFESALANVNAVISRSIAEGVELNIVAVSLADPEGLPMTSVRLTDAPWRRGAKVLRHLKSVAVISVAA